MSIRTERLRRKDAHAIPTFTPRGYAGYGWMRVWLSFTVFMLLTGVCIVIGYRKLVHAQR